MLETVLAPCSYKEKTNNKINLLKDESWITLNDDIHNDDYLFYFKTTWTAHGPSLTDIFCSNLTFGVVLSASGYHRKWEIITHKSRREASGSWKTKKHKSSSSSSAEAVSLNLENISKINVL